MSLLFYTHIHLLIVSSIIKQQGGERLSEKTRETETETHHKQKDEMEKR